MSDIKSQISAAQEKLLSIDGNLVREKQRAEKLVQAEQKTFIAARKAARQHSIEEEKYAAAQGSVVTMVREAIVQKESAPVEISNSDANK